MNNQNAKADKGKPKLSLVPTEIINCIARCREYADSISELPIEESDYKELLYGKAKLNWNGKSVERDCHLWLNAFPKELTPKEIMKNETVNMWLYKYNEIRVPDDEEYRAMYDAVEIVECRVEREVYEI